MKKLFCGFGTIIFVATLFAISSTQKVYAQGALPDYWNDYCVEINNVQDFSDYVFVLDFLNYDGGKAITDGTCVRTLSLEPESHNIYAIKKDVAENYYNKSDGRYWGGTRGYKADGALYVEILSKEEHLGSAEQPTYTFKDIYEIDVVDYQTFEMHLVETITLDGGYYDNYDSRGNYIGKTSSQDSEENQQDDNDWDHNPGDSSGATNNSQNATTVLAAGGVIISVCAIVLVIATRNRRKIADLRKNTDQDTNRIG